MTPRLDCLIVIVPGIGGSVLHDTNGKVAWGPGTRGMGGAAIYRPERLDLSQNLEATDLLPTDSVMAFKKVPGYDGLTTSLMRTLGLRKQDVVTARRGQRLGADASLVLFPYDFRQSFEVSAQALHDEIAWRIHESNHPRRVVVVGHSMGGLVAMWWWAVLGGHSVCERLLTVGTPHRGAPKAMDWLVNDIRWGQGIAAAATGKALARASAQLSTWPSAYELVPRYRAVLLEDTREEPSNGGTYCYPHEVPGIDPAFADKARKAFTRHIQLEQAIATVLEDPAQRHTLRAYYGTGHGTPARATMRGGKLTVESKDAAWVAGPGWEGGDGTVPAISGVPAGFDDKGFRDHRQVLRETHLPMASSEVVVDALHSYGQGPAYPAARGDQEGTDGPRICFDADDVVLADEPSTIGVRLVGAEHEGVSARATLTANGERAAVPPLAVDHNDSGWRLDIPPLAAGTYRLRVELNHVSEVDRVIGHDVVGVFQG